MKGRYLFSFSVACCIIGLAVTVMIAGYRTEIIADVDEQIEQQTQDQASEQPPEQPPEEFPELQEDPEAKRHTLRRKALEMEGTMPKRVEKPSTEAPSTEMAPSEAPSENVEK